MAKHCLTAEDNAGCALCAARRDVKDGKVEADFVAATFFVEGHMGASVQTCQEHLGMLERAKEQAREARERKLA